MKQFFVIFLFICLTLLNTGCLPKQDYTLTINVTDESFTPLYGVNITVIADSCNQAGQAHTGTNGVTYVDLDCSSQPSSAKIILEKDGYSTLVNNERSMKTGKVYSYVMASSSIGSSEAAIPHEDQATSLLPQPTNTNTTITKETPAIRREQSSQLAFARIVDGVAQIFLTDKNETITRQITNTPDGACQPTWSPDGTTLLYITPCTRYQDKYQDTSLYKIDVPDDPNTITADQGELLLSPSGGAYEPAWGVNGIIYTGNEIGRRQIYKIANPNNPHGDLISNPSSEEFGASFSSDGNNVIAFRLLPGYGEGGLLYWVPLDNFQMDISNNWIVSKEYDKIREADWQPNGDFIVFVHHNQLWTSTWKTRKIRQVTELVKGGNIHDPDWSPDGNFIAFSVDKSGSDLDIWYVPLSGRPAKPIAITNSPEFHPAWRPMP